MLCLVSVFLNFFLQSFCLAFFVTTDKIISQDAHMQF